MACAGEVGGESLEKIRAARQHRHRRASGGHAHCTVGFLVVRRGGHVSDFLVVNGKRQHFVATKNADRNQVLCERAWMNGLEIGEWEVCSARECPIHGLLVRQAEREDRAL